MNLATKPNPLDQSTATIKARRQRRNNRQNANPEAAVNLKQLPLVELPSWLKMLLLLKNSSKILALSLIGITLFCYANSVEIPTLWTKEYKKLKTLQGQERELITTNETLKNQFAEEAEKLGNVFVNPVPANAVFLSPSSQPYRSKPENAQIEQHINNINIGY